MKNLIILFTSAVLMISVNSGSAQENSKYVSNNLVKLNFFVPGISYEKALAKTTTLYVSPYFDFLVANEGEGYGGINFYKAPSLDVDLRNYYNIKRRAEKGRYTDHNNANYLSLKYVLRYTVVDPNSGHEFLHQAVLSWGWQHNYPMGIGFDLKLGFRYSFDLESNWYYNPLDLFG